jgi:hypothetical protein
MLRFTLFERFRLQGSSLMSRLRPSAARRA